MAVPTRWGPTVVRSQRLGVMPGTDNVITIGTPMLMHFGLDIYQAMQDSARKGHEDRRVDLGDVTLVRRVNPQGESPMAITRMPNTEMCSADEKIGRDETVEEALSMSFGGVLDNCIFVAEQRDAQQDIMGASTPQGANLPWCNVGTSGQREVDGNMKVVEQLGGAVDSFKSYCDGVT